jgi:multiple sugar transport system substrate-binding protein
VQAIVEGSLKQFMQEHPGVTAEYISTTGQGHLDKVTAAFAAGTPYDVIGNLAPSDTPGFAERDQVRAIDDLVKRDKYDLTDFFEKCVQQYVWKGKLYALPRGFGNQDIYYNAALLDASSVKRPSYDWNDKGWTTDEFLDAATKLTKGGGEQTWGWSQGTGLRQWGPWVWLFGGDILSKDGTKCILDEPPAVDGLQFLQDLIFRHRVMPPPATKLNALNSIGSGQLAMAMDIPANVGGYRKLQGLSFDVAPMPRKATRLTSGGGVAWHLAKATPNLNAAWDLMQWVASKAVQTAECQNGTVAPPRKSVLKSPAYIDRTQPPKGIDVFVQAPDFVHPDPQALGWNDMNDAIDKGLAAFWDGSKTARQVAQEVVPQVNLIVKQNTR